ncbi:DnaD domain-containing protein [Apilactobacillus timberlakei]|uniref:DnaD domain protein n=1 Tax=Apilactobacillus timberlakei TaxID=2008380 RepID=A0ABY2YRV4_9LACO|nr:DnaD domain protein [Apilactobacillus timberlakei]TPR12418.1 DnaD domain protein [Apilactobacillus timberlakei]TPR12958.1 DnaD domain protein [Apilactobacillus timberlakei]
MVKVYKDRDSHFTHIKNDIYESDQHSDVNTLTWKAMGIFGFMWHNPDNWEFYEDELASHSKDGKSALRSGIEELESAGFIKRVQKRDQRGKFSSYDWILNEAPFLENRKSDNPKSDKPKSDNRKLQSTKGTKYLSNKELSSSDDPKSYGALEEYQRVWTFPNAIVQQDLISWIDDLGNDLVKYAIKIAARNNVSKMGSHKYLKAIFKAWDENGVKTIEDAKKQNAKHENSRNNSYGNSNSNNSKKKEVGSYEGFDYF